MQAVATSAESLLTEPLEYPYTFSGGMLLFRGPLDAQVYNHQAQALESMFACLWDTAKKLTHGALRKSSKHSEMDQEIILEGSQISEVRDIFMGLANDLQQRLAYLPLPVGRKIADHIRALFLQSPGAPVQPIQHLAGRIWMAYSVAMFNTPRMYSGDNIDQVIKLLTRLNRMQNSSGKSSEKAKLKLWVSDLLARKGGVICFVVCSTTVGQTEDQVPVFSLQFDEDSAWQGGSAQALSFSYGVKYEKALVRFEGGGFQEEMEVELPTALRRAAQQMEKDTVFWADIFNDAVIEAMLDASESAGNTWAQILLRVYRKNKTYKSGWNGREVNYFNRGWIIQEFLYGRPYEAESNRFNQEMAGLANYESDSRSRTGMERVVWVCCWCALTFQMEGLSQKKDARHAYGGLLFDDELVRDDGVTRAYLEGVLDRIETLWRFEPVEFTNIRETMQLVRFLVGDEVFKEHSLRIDRFLMEDTTLLISSVICMMGFEEDPPDIVRLAVDANLDLGVVKAFLGDTFSLQGTTVGFK